MEWSREYLQRHNVHRILEDCTEDLVVEQPNTKEGIVKTIIQRLETIRRRFDSPQQKVILVLADPISQTSFRSHVDVAASSCGAGIIDGEGLSAEAVRDPLSTAGDKVFIVNFPSSIGSAIAFEGCFGKPHKVALFEDSKFLANSRRSDVAFIDFTKGPNSVAQLYRAKEQLVSVKDATPDVASSTLMSCF
jgi:hypothetical protein